MHTVDFEVRDSELDAQGVVNNAYYFVHRKEPFYKLEIEFLSNHFHELNISLTRHSSNKHKWKSEWIFSINNVYSRHNVFSIYTRADEYDLAKTKTSMLYLYGILPSVTYNFSF